MESLPVKGDNSVSFIDLLTNISLIFVLTREPKLRDLQIRKVHNIRCNAQLQHKDKFGPVVTQMRS